jgi:hypothetical protein
VIDPPRLIWTDHARDRKGVRDVEDREVLHVLLHPVIDRPHPSRPRVRIAEGQLWTVVYTHAGEGGNAVVIITVHASRKDVLGCLQH